MPPARKSLEAFREARNFANDVLIVDTAPTRG